MLAGGVLAFDGLEGRRGCDPVCRVGTGLGGEVALSTEQKKLSGSTFISVPLSSGGIGYIPEGGR